MSAHPFSSRRRTLQALGAGAAVLSLPGWVRAAATTPIVIGRTAALSGTTAYPYLEQSKGIQAALDELNQRGGIAGRPVKLLSLDDAGDPARAGANAKVLVEKEQVVAFLGCGGSPSVLGMLPVISQAKVPLVAPGTGLDALRGSNPLLLFTRASYGHEIAKIAQHLSIIGQERCALVVSEGPLGRSLQSAFESAAREAGNQRWKAFTLGDDAKGLKQTLEDLVAWEPASVMSLAIGPTGIPFGKALRSRVRCPAYSLSLLGAKPVLDALGDAAKGMVISQVAPSPSDVGKPVVKAWRNALRDATASDFSYSSLEGFIGAQVLIDALRRAGDGTDRERLLRAFYAMQPLDLGGFEVRYAPKDNSGTNYVELTYWTGAGYIR